ncbi:hypothetical protein [Vulcanococcus sp.]|jgi:hypothetical protein|uniref:hypothetical protein n=1 Tax=Vulcanococcus sp. TaxID=2856995 RepID=UPI0037D9FC09
MPIRRPPAPPPSRHPAPIDDGDWPVDPGRPWGLRLLALLGAFSFVMIGLSSLLPLLQMPPSDPRPRPAPAPSTGPA